MRSFYNAFVIVGALVASFGATVLLNPIERAQDTIATNIWYWDDPSFLESMYFFYLSLVTIGNVYIYIFCLIKTNINTLKKLDTIWMYSMCQENAKRHISAHFIVTTCLWLDSILLADCCLALSKNVCHTHKKIIYCIVFFLIFKKQNYNTKKY